MAYLSRTSPPPAVVSALCRTRLSRNDLRKRYSEKISKFEIEKQRLELSNDWFSARIPTWLSIIDQFDLRERTIEALEIGSWEGLSSAFILSEMPQAHLTCVDTWEGADEHKDGTFSSGEALDRIEEKFDNNMLSFAPRVSKFRGTSFTFFASGSNIPSYDFIHIDGSHYSDDVLVDAIKGFEVLRVGGVLIFDDYLWRHYSRAIDNPAAAINRFLHAKKGFFKVLAANRELAIVKTSASSR